MTFFGNAWDKYEIVSSEVSISESQAISIALDNLDDYRRSLVGGVMTKLSYRQNKDTDQSFLYPCWQIELEYTETLPHHTRKHITYVQADQGHIWYSADQSFYTSSCNRTSYTIFCTYQAWGDTAANETVHFIHSTVSSREYNDNLSITAKTRTKIEESANASSARDAVFYIGHGNIEFIAGKWHCCLQTHGDNVWDHQVYDNSTGKADLVFFWSCLQGYPSPGGYDSNGDAYGWKFVYGAGTFLGFRGLAPYLSNTIEGVDNAGQVFLQHFYYSMKLGYSIDSALEYASQQTWRQPWRQCPLFRYAVRDDEDEPIPLKERLCGMVRYGDGNWTLGPGLTVKAKDSYGNNLSMWVKIDGEMVGYTELTIEFETEGTYEIYVQPTHAALPYIYNFEKWENGFKHNPRTLYLTSLKTITAYYIRRTIW